MSSIWPVVLGVSSLVSTLISSSESDGEDVEFVLLATRKRTITRRPRIENYVENVVHLYSEYEFKSHFRMTRATFDYLLSLIGPDLKKREHTIAYSPGPGRNTISPEQQLLLAIWTFATPDSYRSICSKFDIGRATAVRAVRRVIKGLVRVKSQFIKWPEYHEVEYINSMFERHSGFSKILGVIDGTHIKITAPRNNAEAYVNRKNWHSIQLQVVCDHTRRFIHCYVGHPGSVHDQRVFRVSGLQDICDNHDNFPYDSHLIGDSAYTIQQHLLVPYKDNGRLTQRQKNFNFCLSSARMVVERSIALLKGRFRSLLDRLPMKRTDLIPYHIMACCVLHNVCIGRNDMIDIPIIIDRNDNEANRDLMNPYLRDAGLRKRQVIMEELQLRNI